jgi:hypothetical protein
VAGLHPEPGPADLGDKLSTLARCVGDVDTFRRTVWGTQPSWYRARDLGAGRGRAFDDVLTLDDVDRLLATSARIPSVRMINGGSPLAPASFCLPVRLGGRWLDDVADPALVTRRLDEGATLVLQSLHRTSPTVAAFVERLQAEISHPVQANGYLTPPSAAGLAEHRDRHDVLALQIHGSKEWWVDGLGDVSVEAGDVLYLPTGTRHRAKTSKSASLHLTIGIIPVTHRSVLRRILECSDDLDGRLAIGYRRSDQRRHLGAEVERILDAALGAIAAVDPEAVLDREQARTILTPTSGGRLVSHLKAGDLTTEHRIRWVAPDPWRRGERPGDDVGGTTPRQLTSERITLALGDRTLAVPATTRPAIRMLLEQQSVRVLDLPGLDESSRVVLARRLVREGACVIEPPPVQAGSGGN